MKPILEKLCRIIADLNVIGEMLILLREEVEIVRSLRIDDYLKILLASERTRETIEILEKITKETESVISMT